MKLLLSGFLFAHYLLLQAAVAGIPTSVTTKAVFETDGKNRFSKPIWLGEIPGKPRQFLVAEHATGNIYSLASAGTGYTKTLFLKVVVANVNEQGFLGIDILRLQIDATQSEPGKSIREEIDIVPKGDNLGWNLMEDTLGNGTGNLVPPVKDFGRADRIATDFARDLQGMIYLVMHNGLIHQLAHAEMKPNTNPLRTIEHRQDRSALMGRFLRDGIGYRLVQGTLAIDRWLVIALDGSVVARGEAGSGRIILNKPTSAAGFRGRFFLL